jgi:hypothetical protein
MELGGSSAAYNLAAIYALDEQDFIAAAGLYAKAYAKLSEVNPRNETLKSVLTAEFKKLAARDPVLAEASIQNFRVPPSAPPNASRWYYLAAADGISPAHSQGKKSQAAFLRTRTLNWYDVNFSAASNHSTASDQASDSLNSVILACCASSRRRPLCLGMIGMTLASCLGLPSCTGSRREAIEIYEIPVETLRYI